MQEELDLDVAVASLYLITLGYGHDSSSKRAKIESRIEERPTLQR